MKKLHIFICPFPGALKDDFVILCQGRDWVYRGLCYFSVRTRQLSWRESSLVMLCCCRTNEYSTITPATLKQVITFFITFLSPNRISALDNLFSVLAIYSSHSLTSKDLWLWLPCRRKEEGKKLLLPIFNLPIPYTLHCSHWRLICCEHKDIFGIKVPIIPNRREGS